MSQLLWSRRAADIGGCSDRPASSPWSVRMRSGANACSERSGGRWPLPTATRSRVSNCSGRSVRIVSIGS